MWRAASKPNLYRYTFTASGQWVVPKGVKSGFISIVGGGGGGYDSGSDVQPGRMISGASGGYLLSYPVNLTENETIKITIGNGGPPNNPGGITKFGDYVWCDGGRSSDYAPPNYGGCSVSGSSGQGGNYIAVGPDEGGNAPIGTSPLGYGSGGNSSRCQGCYSSFGWYDKTHGSSGRDGFISIDVMY